MSTGAPIYLVSACSSGEEFVAAFRRYADRNGLFIPIADPIPVGRRGHFALTLKDGGVMVSGEAEIISSTKTPSVLHGRVGMTLRFGELDADSKTVLIELEKARLSMRPPPPSVPPRPAEVPAAPRPQPPSVGGRIDAMNALAECVAIGDIESMPVVEKAPPKAGPKFVMPAIPASGAVRAKGASTPPTLPTAPPAPIADKSEKVDKATDKAAAERTGPRAPIPSTIPPPVKAPVDTTPDAKQSLHPADTDPDSPFSGDAGKPVGAARPEARTPHEPSPLPRPQPKDVKAAVAALVKDVAARQTPPVGLPRAPQPFATPPAGTPRPAAQGNTTSATDDHAVQRPAAPPPNRARPVEVRGPTAQGSAPAVTVGVLEGSSDRDEPGSLYGGRGVAPGAVELRRPARDSEETGVVTPPVRESEQTGVASPEGSGARPPMREAADDEQTGVVAIPLDKPRAVDADEEQTGVVTPPLAPARVEPVVSTVPATSVAPPARRSAPAIIIDKPVPQVEDVLARSVRDSEPTGIVMPKPALQADETAGRRPARDSEETGIIVADERPAPARLAIAMMAQTPDDAPPEHEVLVTGPASPSVAPAAGPAAPTRVVPAAQQPGEHAAPKLPANPAAKSSPTAVGLAARQIAPAVKPDAIPAATSDEGSGPMLDPMHDPVSGKRHEGPSPPMGKPAHTDPTIPMGRGRIEAALAGNGLDPQLAPAIVVPSSRRADSVIELELGDAGVSLVDDTTDMEVPDLALGAAGAKPTPPTRSAVTVDDVLLGAPGRAKSAARAPAATPPPVPIEGLRARQPTPPVPTPIAEGARHRGAVPLVDEQAPGNGRLGTEHGVGGETRAPASTKSDEARPPRTPTPSAPLPIARKPAVELSSLSDIEIDEPTDLTNIPTAPEPAVPVAAKKHHDSAGTREPRRTVIGIAVSQSGEHMVPAAPVGEARSTVVMSQQEPSAGIVGPANVDAHAATIPPEPVFAPPDDDPIAPPPKPARVASRSVPPPVAAAAPPVRNTPPPVAAAPPVRNTPPPVAPPQTGDWTISLDENAPDGWSEPSKPAIQVPLIANAPEPEKARPKMIQASTVLAAANTPAVGARKPNENERKRGWSSGPTLERNEPLERPNPADIIPDEPKVQIDPTLIEPLTPMPTEDEPAASGSAPGLAVGTTPADQMPPMVPPMVPQQHEHHLAQIPSIAPQPMMPGPVPGSYLTPVPGSPVPQQPGYAMDPNAQMQMIGFAPHQQRMVTDGGVGFFHDDQREVRYPSEQVIAYDRHRRRRIFVIAASAALVVLLGITLLVVLGGGGKSDDDKPKEPEGSSSAPEPKKQPLATAPSADAPSGEDKKPDVTPEVTTDAAPSEPAPTCFADLSSVPAGAEVRRGKDVVGATPFKLPLPCGETVTLTFIKQGYPSVDKEVLPKAEAPRVNVVFPKPQFNVRVTSTPTGAAVTLNGKAAGVTPGIVRINGFEPSTLTFAKSGYVTQTMTVAPRANGTGVNAVLKAVPRRR